MDVSFCRVGSFFALVFASSTYLDKDHGRDLLGGEGLGLAEVLDLDHGGSTLVGDLEGPGLDILLDGGIVKTATDKTPGRAWSDIVAHVRGSCRCSLDIEDGVLGVHGSLVLSGLTDQTLLSSEGNERRSGEATLLVGNCAKALEYCADLILVLEAETY